MPEIEIPDIDPEIHEDPEFQQDGEAVEREIENTQNYVKENASKADDAAFKANFTERIQQQNVKTVKSLKRMAEKSNIDLSDEDASKLEDLFNESIDIGNLDENSVKDIQTKYNNLPDNVKAFYEKYSDFCQDTFSKKLQSIDSFKESYNKNKSDWQSLKDAYNKASADFKNNPDDPAAAEALNKSLSDMSEEGKKVADDIDKKEPGLKEKLGSILYTLMVLGAMFGMIYGLMAILADGLSGCYVYYNMNENDGLQSDKLEGCSSFYKDEANRKYCDCYGTGGADVAPGTKFDDTTCNDGDDVHCPYPYCVGHSNCKSGTSTCSFPAKLGKTLQCTNVSPNTAGYVNYGFQLYTPSSLIGKAVAAVANDFNDIFGAVSSFLKNLPKYLLYAGIFFIIAFILYIIFKKITGSSHKEASSVVVVSSDSKLSSKSRRSK